MNELGTTHKLLVLILPRELKYVGHAIHNERTDLEDDHLHHLLEASQTPVARNFKRWSDLERQLVRTSYAAVN